MLQLQYLVLNEIFKTPNEYFLLKRFSWMVFIVLFLCFRTLKSMQNLAKLKLAKIIKWNVPLMFALKKSSENFQKYCNF